MRVHNKVLEVSNVAPPFKVLSGVAMVFCTDFGFPVPTGGTWPGTQLNQKFVDLLQPAFVQLLPGTAFTTDARRPVLLPQEAVTLDNSTTVAEALAATREHLAKKRTRNEAQLRLLTPSCAHDLLDLAEHECPCAPNQRLGQRPLERSQKGKEFFAVSNFQPAFVCFKRGCRFSSRNLVTPPKAAASRQHSSSHVSVLWCQGIHPRLHEEDSTLQPNVPLKFNELLKLHRPKRFIVQPQLPNDVRKGSQNDLRRDEMPDVIGREGRDEQTEPKLSAA